MTLNVDFAAEADYSQIIRGLWAARTTAGLTQSALAEHLPFRSRVISEWETGAVEPKLNNLLLAVDALQHRLVLISGNGHLVPGPIQQQPGEAWTVFLRRQLATPLRNRRVARGLNQAELGRLIGVSRDSIKRWELARVPPRPIAHVVWAQKLGYTLVLAPHP